MLLAVLRSLFTTGLLILAVGSSIATAGANGGGGGSAVRRDRHLTLLELYVSSPRFNDTFSDPDFSRIKRDVKQELNDFRKNRHNGERNWVALPLTAYNFSLLDSTLGRWQKSSPLLIGAIKATILETSFRVFLGPLPQVENYYIPDGLDLDRRSVVTIAYYSKQFPLETFFAPEVFTKLGDMSFVGLIVHEALRKLKINNGVKISEKLLQSITAKILLTSPQAGETLDTPDILGSSVSAFKRSAYPLDSLCGHTKRFLNLEPNQKVQEVYTAHCFNNYHSQLDASITGTATSNQSYNLVIDQFWRTESVAEITSFFEQNYSEIRSSVAVKNRVLFDHLFKISKLIEKETLAFRFNDPFWQEPYTTPPLVKF